MENIINKIKQNMGKFINITVMTVAIFILAFVGSELIGQAIPYYLFIFLFPVVFLLLSFQIYIKKDSKRENKSFIAGDLALLSKKK